MAIQQSKHFEFKKAAISDLPTPTKTRATYYDTKSQGLCLLVQTSGHRAFGWYRSVDGRPLFKNVGVHPDLTVQQARDKATEFNNDLAKWKANGFEGPSPFGPKKANKALTVGDMFDSYCDLHLATKAKTPETAIKNAKWIFKTYMAALRDLKPRQVTRGDVKTLHAELVRDIGPHTANRAVQLLRATFNHAIDGETFEGVNPCKIKLPQEPKRLRSLQANELPNFFKALTREKNVDLRDFILLALYTGARRGDVLSMRWDCLELKSKEPTWVIPNPKNRVPYTVGLEPEAIDVLKRRATDSKSPWVFPNETSATGHLLDCKKGWAKFLKRAKLVNFRVHDLRHTFASAQANKGTSLQIIGKSLGHSSVVSTERYAQPDAQPVRASVSNGVAAMLSNGKITRKELAALPPAKPRRAIHLEDAPEPLKISQ